MASLLTNAQKNNMSEAMDSVFDTFKQTFRVWQKPELTVISTPDEYNFIIGGAEKTEITNVPSYTDFEGIIHYMKPQEIQSYLAGQGRLEERFNAEKVMIKIKCKEDGYNAIKNSVAIELDNRRFKIASGGRQHGLFTRNYFTVLLEELI